MVAGMPSRETHVVYREMVGQVLSILSFPFWVVESKQRGKRVCTIVDAVSQDVVAAEVPSSLLSLLEQPHQRAAEVVGFRSLVCPNCGWELPVTPNDSIFLLYLSGGVANSGERVNPDIVPS